MIFNDTVLIFNDTELATDRFFLPPIIILWALLASSLPPICSALGRPVIGAHRGSTGVKPSFMVTDGSVRFITGREHAKVLAAATRFYATRSDHDVHRFGGAADTEVRHRASDCVLSVEVAADADVHRFGVVADTDVRHRKGATSDRIGAQPSESR